VASPVRVVPGQWVNIASATTTVVKAGRGVLRRIIVNNVVASTISVYNHPTGASNPIAVIGASAPIASLPYDLEFSLGLTIVTAGASNLTVVYE